MRINTVAYEDRLGLDPAFDPAASVFVSASAGTGKTSLLTRRVLSLLLHGALPSKILCLTFTHAGASEMKTRILAALGHWVTMPQEKLEHALSELTGAAPTSQIMQRARSLFAEVLEAPEGLRIETIHGFCQSLLRRFPLEAGVSPHFTVMEARDEQEALGEARLRLLNLARRGGNELNDAVDVLARTLHESTFGDLLSELVQHKRKLFHRLRQGEDARPVALDIPSLVAMHFSYEAHELMQLRRISELLLSGEGKSDQSTGAKLVSWCEITDARHESVFSYLETYITQDGTARKSLFTKKTLTDAALVEALQAEQMRALGFYEAWRSQEIAKLSGHVLALARALLGHYTDIKRSRGWMDYDDLIMTACDLLLKPGIAPWILFKLDGGIDHILVDEAQDTSPQQWLIVSALTEEFFAGLGRSENTRSLFIVGDEKQSIFSFQGAEPLALSKMQHYFSRRIQESGNRFHHLELTRSFRSAPEILLAVDRIFAQAEAKRGLTFDDTAPSHVATRLEHPGVVECWPLSVPQENGLSPRTELARRIANTIEGWLKNSEMLPAKNRPIRADDIIILVRERAGMAGRLVRALKRRGIPVAGMDRMVLGDNLAVQDLMALGQILLLPEDDLTLAALLKSPIFNMSEEQLFALSWNRGELSLWERLSRNEECKESYALLTDLRAKTDFSSPFEIYSLLLETHGARRRFIGRMGEEYNDPIDEFLEQALLYERTHAPSLQGFLHWMMRSNSTIKRDMEAPSGSVRIMTVHGAKGLQAPIVFLPDTTSIPRMRDMLLWHEEEQAASPVWSASPKRDNALCRELREKSREAMMAEYHRLLYVALTRAEDRLYICGALGKDKLNEQSWYHLIHSGLAEIAQPFEHPLGEGLRVGDIIYSPLEGESKSASETPRGSVGGKVVKLPPTLTLDALRIEPVKGGGNSYSFLTTSLPHEPHPPQPLAPSHLATKEPAALSPLSALEIYQRGNVIHALLQYLPDVACENRLDIAHRIAASRAREMSENDIASCIHEALHLLDDPAFAFLFGPGSLAEVPLTGIIEREGKPVVVSGQIDRLYIGEREVWIIDYKSGRLSPRDEADIPQAYIEQLQLYRQLLERIYPDKTIHCALLWTAAAKLTPIAP